MANNRVTTDPVSRLDMLTLKWGNYMGHVRHSTRTVF